MNLGTVKWAQFDEPNPENCKNCSSNCAYDCAQLQYTIQHSSDNIPSYLQTIIIAQMLSIGGEGGFVKRFYTEIIIVTQIIQQIWNNMTSSHQPVLNGIFIMPCEMSGSSHRLRAMK